VPILDKRAVDEAVRFDLRFDHTSMPTLLDTLLIDSLQISFDRLHKDHVRDVIVGEIFATRRGWGMSPAQIVLYLDVSTP
jgi:hypothetical protein